jgi:hypothetical protein
MEQEKQCQHTNNLYLYCEEPCHVVHECPKKHKPHATHTIFVTNSQPEESENKHV